MSEAKGELENMKAQMEKEQATLLELKTSDE